MSHIGRALHHVSTRRVTVGLGVACLLLVGVSVPAGLTTAQAGPSVHPRNGASPATTYAVIRLIPVGREPNGVAVDQDDDTVYVTNTQDDNVSVINGRTGQRTDDTIIVGTGPVGVAIDQGDDTVYVANSSSNDISIIAGRTRAGTVRMIGLGSGPIGVAVDEGDDTVYVSNRLNGTVSFVEGRTAQVMPTTTFVGSGPYGVAVAASDSRVYVASSFSRNAAVINGLTGAVERSYDVGTLPRGVAVNQIDDTVYVTNYGSGEVSVISGRTNLLTDDTITVGNSPFGVAVNQVDDTVYVANFDDSTVSVVNGRTGFLTDDTIVVGGNPAALAIDDMGVNQGLLYISGLTMNAVSVVGRASPSLGASSGNAGDTVTINVDVPQVAYEVDDSTVTSVSFGGTVFNNPSPLSGDAWQVIAPSRPLGTTVAVTVTFRGGLTASAGTFTYNLPPTPTPTPTPTQPQQPLPPGAPAPVLAQAGDRSAEVTWGASSFSGSGPVTEYEAEAFPGGNICRATPPTTSCKVTGLSNGSGYLFRVRAKNYVGWGSWSEYSNMVTPKGAASIVITGSRDRNKPKVIKVSGTTTGLTGSVTPWLRLGSGPFKVEPPVRLTSSGAFRWSAKTSAAAQVYVTQGSVTSNTVTIRAR